MCGNYFVLCHPPLLLCHPLICYYDCGENLSLREPQNSAETLNAHSDH